MDGEAKDKEIRDLNRKLISMVKNDSVISSEENDSKLNELMTENINLVKQLESYKNKLTSLASNFDPIANQITPGTADEVKKVRLEKFQLEEQVANYKKQINAMSEQSLEDRELIGKLLVQVENKPEVDPNIPSEFAVTLKKSKLELSEAYFKISKYQSNVAELQNKINELTSMISKAGGGKTEAGIEKARVTQLEKLMTKLTADFKVKDSQLMETKKEVQKYKADRTALMHELDKARREIEKLKNMTPKNTPSGGKVA